MHCKFCNTAQRKYLYLNCKHLCCLSCAFLRSNFSTYELICCHQVTKIEKDAMETIIKSTMNDKSKMKYMEMEKSLQLFARQSSGKTSSKGSKGFWDGQAISYEVSDTGDGFYGQGKYKDRQEHKKQYKQNNNRISNQLQNILKGHIEKIHIEFEQQEKQLKQKEQKILKNIITTFYSSIKTIDKPVSQAKQQKINTILQIQSNKLVNNSNQQQISRQQNKASICFENQQNENYNRILRKLQQNKQKMKQSIRRHLQQLY